MRRRLEESSSADGEVWSIDLVASQAPATCVYQRQHTFVLDTRSAPPRPQPILLALALVSSCLEPSGARGDWSVAQSLETANPRRVRSAVVKPYLVMVNKP